MKKVLVLDSGSGGINVLHECIKVCPCFDYLFFADNKNLPYGEKSKDELIEITRNNLNFIKSFFNFEIVIFACNTITATTISKMREEFCDVIFIGTEPAINLALKKYKPNEILLIATESTIKNNKLVKKNFNTKMHFKVIKNLPNLIDENLFSTYVLQDYLTDELKEFSDCKSVILGCTHFHAIENEIKNALKNIEIFSSAKGVAKRLLNFCNDTNKNFNLQFMVSGDYLDLQKFYAYFNYIDLTNL